LSGDWPQIPKPEDHFLTAVAGNSMAGHETTPEPKKEHVVRPFTPPDVAAVDEALMAEGVLPESAMAPPRAALPTPTGVTQDRSFGFVDLCGFSAFTAAEGTEAAYAALSHFREIVRAVASQRGVRVAKWLGDGAMMIGLGPGPLVATMAELVVRFPAQIRAGVAAGPALLFEADDYVGEPVNRAARLCDLAFPDTVLASPEVIAHIPSWTVAEEIGPLDVRSLGTISGICRITVSHELERLMDAQPMPDAASAL
jgi:adenylate cyclase